MQYATIPHEFHGKDKPIRQWLKEIEINMGYSHVTYIIRSLYNIIIGTKKRGFGKDKLIHSIERFERDSLLPEMFSLFEPDYLISELEDVQHLYPVSRCVVDLPSFVQ